MTSPSIRWGHLGLCTAAAAVVLSGCGGNSDSPTTATRPSTPARLQIAQPTVNQVTGPDTQLKLDLIGAEVVPETTGPLTPDQGHIHVSVDGKLISMTYSTSQDLHALTPGPHAVQAEFVAKDHAPFRNRVVAAVLFNVQP